MAIATRGLTRLFLCAALMALATAPACSDDEVGRQVATLDDTTSGLPTASSTPPAEPTRKPSFSIETLRETIDLYRKGDLAGGDRARSRIGEPGPRALTEWLAIRFGGAAVGFNRIVEFIRDNPTWPVGASLRRRTEEALFTERKPPAVVRAYFATQRPATVAGKLALALAFKSDGLGGDAAALIREAWRDDTFGRDLEERILESFPGVLTQADHRFRMERFLFKESWDSALRAAGHAGKDYVLLAKARMAVEKKAGNAAKALDAVPPSLRADTSFLFSRAQFHRRKDNPAEAAKIIADVTRDVDVLVDGDQWWEERRIVARKLLDQGDAKTAYLLALNHAAETAANQIEAEFHAGWIALRFLNQADVAAVHFAEAAKVAVTPISVARSAYWQGRAAEAGGQEEDARRFYEKAARQPITYYGQLASAKLGLQNLPLRAVDGNPAGREAFDSLAAAQALKLLHEAGVRELAMPLYLDLAQRLTDATHLNALGDLAVEQRDSRALLAVGKTAVQRGFPLDLHAFPTIGIPAFDPVGDRVEKAMVYAIARQESAFDPRAQSHAGARGLMQLMPATAKRTAKRFGVGFDLDRLLSDASYNAKIGAAHLGELMEDWKGSLILTFASYNAGGGNVKKWIDAYGDPRSPAVDPIDWVERIPFSETRNYVQRVMENLQVYRNRLGERSVLLIESDLRGKRAVQ
jgi:soluble lytic murein transglycosylase